MQLLKKNNSKMIIIVSDPAKELLSQNQKKMLL